MLSSTLTLLLAASSVFTLPVQKREVPQEHSHEQFLTAVRTSLNLDNPDGIVDPVFGLLGNAAASQGQGQITDTDCLHQATADRAFTNAKAAGDVQGQVAALIFRTLERNTGRVGQASVLCTAIQAVNPEIAALSQHQDPASANAAQINKDITLELARQIAAVGGDPLDALKAGTFAPGDVNDPTGRGNSCNVLEDPVGCIFTQNLLVPDATEEEILAAVGGAAPPAEEPAAEEPAAEEPAAEEPAAETPADCPPATVTVTVTAGAEATPSAATTTAAAVQTTAAVVQTTAAQATPTAAPAAGGNLQKFTGALGGLSAPGVRAGGRGFVVDNNSDFLNIGAALNRSCDVQHNQCANKANAERQFSVGDCDAQNTQCKAAI